MRELIGLAALATGACATVPAETDVPVHGEVAGYDCRKPSERDFIGQPATAELGARMLAEARARTIRWVPHGAAVTMEFNPSRLTVQLDPQNRIASISCG